MAGSEFLPLLSGPEVTRRCRDALNGPLPHPVAHVVAHAIVAQRVTAVADLDVTDGPIGRFLRTGEVTNEPARHIWTPLFGRVCTFLPENLLVQAGALAVYLKANPGRGPVEGWPKGGPAA